MADETKVVMAIPSDVISAQVHAAVAGVLMERGNELIATMVKEVLTQPARDSYGNEITERYNGKRVAKTRFQLIVEKGIQDAANEEAKKWVDEQKDEIKKAVRAYLGRTHKDLIAKIASDIVDGLKNPSVYLRVRFGGDDDE